MVNSDFMANNTKALDDNTFRLFRKAVKDKDLELMQQIYYDNWDNLLIKFNYAKLVIASGDLAHGRTLLMEILKKKMDLYTVFELGKLEVILGNIDSARLCFETILKKKFDVYATLELAKLELHEKNNEKARELLESLLETKGRHPALLELGRMDASNGNYDEARKKFGTILEEKNDNYAILELAVLDSVTGKYDNAINAFKYLLDLNFKKDYVMLRLGIVYSQMENIDMCKEYLLPLLKYETVGGQAALELGKVHMKKGYYDKAKKYFDMALNSSLKDLALLELGRMEIRRGNYEEARNILNSINSSDNSNDHAKLELAKLEALIGNYDVAKDYYSSLIGGKNEMYAIVELGKLAFIQGNYDLSRKYFKSLLGTPIEYYVYSLLIILEFKIKNYNRAIELASEALNKGYTINNDIIITLSQKFNIFFDIDYESIDYNFSLNQMANYDKERVLRHILEGHIDSNDKNNFNSDIDIEKLMEEIKPELNDNNKHNKFEFNDVYIIPYANIGNNGENFLKVITIPNTLDIISMYPVYDKYDYEYDDNDQNLAK